MVRHKIAFGATNLGGAPRHLHCTSHGYVCQHRKYAPPNFLRGLISLTLGRSTKDGTQMHSISTNECRSVRIRVSAPSSKLGTFYPNARGPRANKRFTVEIVWNPYHCFDQHTALFI